eukprot:9493728-Pyramimonas_sp.AAC.1
MFPFRVQRPRSKVVARFAKQFYSSGGDGVGHPAARAAAQGMCVARCNKLEVASPLHILRCLDFSSHLRDVKDVAVAAGKLMKTLMGHPGMGAGALASVGTDWPD